MVMTELDDDNAAAAAAGIDDNGDDKGDLISGTHSQVALQHSGIYINWCFTPSQPVRLHQGGQHSGGNARRKRRRRKKV